METLKRLLAPYPIEQFLAQNWTQQAVYLAANHRHKFRDLFSWKALNHLLNFHRIPYPDLRFSLDGKSFPVDDRKDWHDRLRQGATLVINHIHELVPSVAELAVALRYELGHCTQVNLYCSPAEQQGFDCHYDTHDVLILQIDGEKKWFIFPETIPYPVAESRSPDQLPPDEPPYLKCVLQPGDVLYIPRGHWHYAISCDRPSLHLTVGIDCETGLDWLKWLVGELQNQPEWRQNLPFTANGDTDALEQRLEQLRRSLSQSLHQPELVQKYLQHFASQELPDTPFSLPAQLGVDIFDQGFETRFFRTKTQIVQIEPLEDEAYQITIGSKRIALKGVPLSLVENIFTQECFSILDLGEWAPDLDFEGDVVPLLTRLVMEGVLFVEG
ncbi:cupin domain-containing protein [Kovacikia minuta CCNUW1]|uniref:cupin domain-containing protein n=1 Tax=Kovacikia minuta TaxID=2931930 RepID=UPI001CC91DE3|nr:cupin domain-containing protein [Kovacikia minuta]UBF27199.1 cupin domain-containing protein [Kovacikia minuta CCNUW1]